MVADGGEAPVASAALCAPLRVEALGERVHRHVIESASIGVGWRPGARGGEHDLKNGGCQLAHAATQLDVAADVFFGVVGGAGFDLVGQFVEHVAAVGKMRRHKLPEGCGVVVVVGVEFVVSVDDDVEAGSGCGVHGFFQKAQHAAPLTGVVQLRPGPIRVRLPVALEPDFEARQPHGCHAGVAEFFKKTPLLEQCVAVFSCVVFAGGFPLPESGTAKWAAVGGAQDFQNPPFSRGGVGDDDGAGVGFGQQRWLAGCQADEQGGECGGDFHGLECVLRVAPCAVFSMRHFRAQRALCPGIGRRRQ